MRKIKINDLGRAIARSGLLPSTANYFIEYLRDHVTDLKRLLPSTKFGRDGIPQNLPADFDDMAVVFVLVHVCFTSPEFGGRGLPARRNIPFQLGQRRPSQRASNLEGILAVRPWDRDVLAVNAAELVIDWISGCPFIELEGRFENLRAGVLRDMYRTLVGHLTGFADVVVGMVVAHDLGELPDQYNWVSKERGLLFRAVRRLRQAARSVAKGVPEDMLWLAELADSNNKPLCKRPEVIACYRRDLRALESIVDPGRKTDLINAMKDAQSDPERWKLLRTGAISYRIERTSRRKSAHQKRLPAECKNLVDNFYVKRGVYFEDEIQKCFDLLSIKVLARDDSSQKGKSFPDFVIELEGRRVIIECKSCDGDNDVALGDAAEVFKKAGIQNFNTEPLVTICQPYVATDVPRKIEASERLTVVNAEDLAEALVRLHLKKLDHARFLNWITTPGQPSYEELG